MQYLLSILYFLITLGFPNLYTYFMGTLNIPLFKIVNILLLACSQILLLNINPLIFASGKPFREHIKFCLSYYLPMLVGISIIINFLPFPVGLPHPLQLTMQSIFSAFMVPYLSMISYMYIARYVSLHAANIAILSFLLSFNLSPFTLNPMILMFSCISRGFSMIYLIQMVSLFSAIYTLRNNLITRLFYNYKKIE
jgi:hypothetical protein